MGVFTGATSGACSWRAGTQNTLDQVISYLDGKAARQLASTCRVLFALCSEDAPGLQRPLHPRQVCTAHLSVIARVCMSTSSAHLRPASLTAQ